MVEISAHKHFWKKNSLEVDVVVNFEWQTGMYTNTFRQLAIIERDYVVNHTEITREAMESKQISD